MTLIAYLNNNIQVRCLLDTGSQIDVIHPHIVDKFQIETQQLNNKLNVQYVGGKHETTTKKLTNTTISFIVHNKTQTSKHLYTSVFEPHVANTPDQYDIVIGLPWLALNIKSISIKDYKLKLLNHKLYTIFAITLNQQYINKLNKQDPRTT